MNKKNKIELLIFTLSLFLVLATFFYAASFNDYRANGDSYMTVLFSKVIANEGSLNFDIYGDYAGLWGKEAKIYFTPSLHTGFFILNGLTGQSTDFVVYLFLFVFVIMVMLLLYRLFGVYGFAPFSFFIIFYAISFMREKRYYLTPGYHFQNMFGDFLLLALLLVISISVKKYLEDKKISWPYLILSLIFYVSLFFFHQMTFFITSVILIILIPYLFFKLKIYKKFSVSSGLITISAIFLIFLLIFIFLFSIGYVEWIVETFSELPKSSYQYQSMRDVSLYGKLIWNPFVMYGSVVALAYLLLVKFYDKDNVKRTLLVISIIIPSAVILFLTKGPLFNIKVMPIRALWFFSYFAIAALSIFLFEILKRIGKRTRLIVIMLFITLSVTTIGAIDFEADSGNIYSSNSASNEEVEQIADVILDNLEEGDYVEIIHPKCKSCIWIRTHVVPEKKINFIEKEYRPQEADLIITNDLKGVDQSRYSLFMETENFILFMKNETTN